MQLDIWFGATKSRRLTVDQVEEIKGMEEAVTATA
jgi:hypothetical protein